MTSVLRTTALCLSLFTVMFIGTGCGGGGSGPELGSVTGVITLDGKPLEGANIEFTPVGGAGRPSAGESDSSGYYSLTYKGTTNGARIGEHEVTMTTFQEAMNYGGAEGFEDMPGRDEEIPKKYAAEKLRVKVEPGSNTINLELTSD